MKYYITFNNQTIGPMTIQQMMAYPVTRDTPVSEDGGEWRPLYTYPAIMEVMGNMWNGKFVDPEVSSKKTLCGIMAILFGTLGIQYFVVGKTAGGLITMFLSLITCGFWGIITLIQGIVILCMDDETFKRKYIDLGSSTLPLF